MSERYMATLAPSLVVQTKNTPNMILKNKSKHGQHSGQNTRDKVYQPVGSSNRNSLQS